MEEFLIDYSSLKIGDKLYCILRGEVEVKHLDYTTEYHICCTSKDGTRYSYTKEGYAHRLHTHPTLFKSNPFEHINNGFKERVMLVSNDETKWHKRVVFIIKNNEYIAWNYVTTLEDAIINTGITSWKYAKELEEEINIPEYTMEELTRMLGKEFKIKK